MDAMSTPHEPPREPIDPERLYGLSDPDQASGSFDASEPPREAIDPERLYGGFDPEPVPEQGPDLEEVPLDGEPLPAQPAVAVEEEPEERDMGRYWPLFLVGGLVVAGAGWLLLSGVNQDEDPVASAPATTVTATQPAEQDSSEQDANEPVPDATAAPSSEAQEDIDPPAPAPEDAPEDAGEDAPEAAPEDSGEDAGEQSIAPADPVIENEDLLDVEGSSLEGLPELPQEVSGLTLSSVDAGTAIYRGADAAMTTVQFNPEMNDTDIAAMLQSPAMVGDWVCGQQGQSVVCIGHAHSGRVIVTGGASFDDTVLWGEALVAAWS